MNAISAQGESARLIGNQLRMGIEQIDQHQTIPSGEDPLIIPSIVDHISPDNLTRQVITEQAGAIKSIKLALLNRKGMKFGKAGRIKKRGGEWFAQRPF